MVIRWITSPIFTESGEYNIITAMAVTYHNRCWARPEISMDKGRATSPFSPSMDKGQVASLLLSLLWTTSMDEYGVGLFLDTISCHFVHGSSLG